MVWQGLAGVRLGFSTVTIAKFSDSKIPLLVHDIRVKTGSPSNDLRKFILRVRAILIY